MALILADRVKESTTTTGTSDFALGGAITGFQTFAAAVGANNTTYYAIADGADWEVGLGTLSSDGLTLARTTVLQSSNSDSKVSFASGTKHLFVTYAADKAVFEDASGNVTLPANLTVIGGSTTDSVQLDLTAAVTPAVGQIAWDAAQGTASLGLLGGNIISRLGQSLVAYVTNAESVTITKGQAVYLFSAQGDRATVKLAYNTGDATSAKTLGIVAEDITANGTGFVICQGVAYGLDLAAYTAGDTLYLGATAGSLTATKPYAPNHLVYMGVVEKANSGAGQLYVRVQNGYELDEIHNVSAQSPTTGQQLVYNASTSLWEKSNAPVISGGSINNTTIGATTASSGAFTTLSASSDVTLSGGTANGVLYLNGSKQASSGSALTFDGTRLTSTTGKFGGGAASNSASLMVNNATNTATGIQLFQDGIESWIMGMPANSAGLAWSASGSEAMRLTSTSLYTASGINVGIGTNLPLNELEASKSSSGGLGAVIVATNSATPAAGNSSSIGFRPSANFVAAGYFGARIAAETLAANNNVDLVFYNYKGISASGNENMRLTSAGYLGLGTNNPSSILTVAVDDSTGTLGPRVVGVTDPNKQLRISYNTTSNYANIQSIHVGTAYTNLVLQKDGGNVGINTTNAPYSLSVSSGAVSTVASFSSSATPTYSASSYNGSSAKLQLIGGNATNSFNAINFTQGGSFELLVGGVQNSAGAGYADFVIQGYGRKYDGSTETYFQRLKVDDRGNLLLNYGGTGFLNGGVITDEGQFTGIRFYGNSDGNLNIFNRSTNASYGNVIVTSGNQETARFTASNKVGIGTDSPSAKLEIRDDVAATTSLNSTAIKLFNNLDGGSGIEFSNGVLGKSKISFGVESSGAGTDDTYLGFSTCQNGGALTERVRIASAGDLTILSGRSLFFNNSANTANASIVCTGGGTLSLLSYGNEMISLYEDNTIIFKTSGGSEKARINANGLFEAKYGSYSDPSLVSSGHFGLQIATSAYYDDNSAHTPMLVNSMTGIAYIRSQGSLSAIPFYSNGGGGIAYQWTALNPQTGLWINSSGPTVNFTEAGASPNSYSVVFGSGGGQFTITRTGGSNAYYVSIQIFASP